MGWIERVSGREFGRALGCSPDVAELVWQRDDVAELSATFVRALEENPALAAADVGIAGTAVALEAGDVVPTGDDLSRVPMTLDLGPRATAIMLQNLIWVMGVIGVVLITALVGWLSLTLVVIRHEGSAVVPVFDGLWLLRRTRPGDPGACTFGLFRPPCADWRDNDGAMFTLIARARLRVVLLALVLLALVAPPFVMVVGSAGAALVPMGHELHRHLHFGSMPAFPARTLLARALPPQRLGSGDQLGQGGEIPNAAASLTAVVPASIALLLVWLLKGQVGARLARPRAVLVHGPDPPPRV